MQWLKNLFRRWFKTEPEVIVQTVEELEILAMMGTKERSAVLKQLIIKHLDSRVSRRRKRV